jgi:ribosome recycling factor
MSDDPVLHSLHEDLSEMAEELRKAVEVIRFYARRGVVSPKVDDEIAEDGGDKARAILARLARAALAEIEGGKKDE